MAVLDSYTWIFGVGTVFSFISAFGIGANDIANAFASSVGSKALTMPQVILIGAVCEFTGAILLGASVTDTIKSKIAKPEAFAATPELLMYGFLCVLIAAAFWDNLASHLGLPVSTTHTTVGGTVGMAIVLRGFNAVIWSKKKSSFPKFDGMSAIFASWGTSPLLAGVFTVVLYGFTRTVILRSKDSFRRAFYILPIFVGLTFFIVTFFIIQTGNKNATWNTPVANGKAVWISVIVAVGFAILTLVAVMPFLKRSLEREDAILQDMANKRIEEAKGLDTEKGATVAAPDGEHAQSVEALSKTAAGQRQLDVDIANFGGGFHFPGEKAVSRCFSGLRDSKLGQNLVMRTLFFGANYKIHDDISKDPTTERIWAQAEVFDYKTERMFRYLQVFSAMVMSFAHGSNDVANAIGPYTAIYQIWRTGVVSSKSSVPTWILAMGGAGIVAGLATFGYKIMSVLGVRTSKLSNSRGFCVELSTATAVVLASRYGLPISTTQTITGAIIAIGLFEGLKGLNYRVLFRIFFGWVLTLIIAALVAGVLAAWGAYAPNKFQTDDLVYVNQYMNAGSNALLVAAAAGGDATVASSVVAINSTLAGLTGAIYQYPRLVTTTFNDSFNLFTSTVCSASPSL
eukprot:jgi/Chlat1/1408/Chrsp12S00101